MPSTLVQRLQQVPARADQHRWLLFAAGGMAVASLLLMMAGGYHAGFHTLNDAGRVIGDRPLQTLTQSGDTLFVLSLFLTLAWRHPQAIWHAVLAALIATLLSHGIKAIADQMRPPAVLDLHDFRHLGPLWRRDSFPSGHTVTAFVAAGALACEWRVISARLFALGVAALIGFSRVAVGAHWPADVLAGGAIGLLSVWLGLLAMRQWRWGLGLRGHLILVALLSGCAIADFIRVPAYVDAQAVARAVACIGLALAVWRYVVVPSWAGRPLFEARAFAGGEPG
ncbi:MAG: phosphatase PAP2 family protein [Solimonas sp.]